MRPTELARSLIGQSIARSILRPMMRWQPLEVDDDGYSIVLGTPWDLRHLLAVNLRFIERVDLSGLREIVVVFDRGYRDEMDQIAEATKSQFSSLPIRFMWYRQNLSRVIEKINISTFYNSANAVSAIASLRTKFAIMHDFDLYPLSPDYFRVIWEAMQSRGLYFSGLELTPFYGLSAQDAVIGTWALGIDIQYLRSNWGPIDCFHRISRLHGRWLKLDPFSWIQLQTAERGLAANISGKACHVKNLCSTYLRLVSGGQIAVVWRLHYLWYLEYLAGDHSRLEYAIELMRNSENGVIQIHGRAVDFASVNEGAASYLRKELEAMESALFGRVRPEIEVYLCEFERFLGD